MQKFTYTAITAASYANTSNEDIAIDIWESYNDINGIKPRGMNLFGKDSMSREDLIKNAVYYMNYSNESYARKINERRNEQAKEIKRERGENQRAKTFNAGFNSLAMAF